MKIPQELLKEIKWTDEDAARGTIMLQGPPRCGKTVLAQKLAEAVVGKNNTFLLDWPEEEGTPSLADVHVPYRTLTNETDLELWYSRIKKMQPGAIIWDGLVSSYWLLMNERVPSGVMPEDHGKTWMSCATALRRWIVRFKLLSHLFVITSLVWPDKDEITGKEGRLQVIIPGQLKSNIYGLFSYNLLIELEDQPNGEAIRILRTKPAQRFVAGIRAPINNKIPAKISYDLNKPGTAEKIVELIGIKPYVEPVQEEEANGGNSNGGQPVREDVGATETGGETGSTESRPKLPKRKVLKP